LAAVALADAVLPVAVRRVVVRLAGELAAVLAAGRVRLAAVLAPVVLAPAVFGAAVFAVVVADVAELARRVAVALLRAVGFAAAESVGTDVPPSRSVTG
jgi:hypothetical protein